MKKDISRKRLTTAVIVLAAVRIVLASRQMIFSLPGSAPIDDDLFFAWAVSISEGSWLGEYNYLTLSKYPFFAVYLALLHFVKIPYLIANCILWILTRILAYKAFSPVLRTNLGRLFVFIAVAYNPSTWAMHTLRVYRDSLFPILCTVFFLSVAGWALRIKDRISEGMPFMLIAGLGLALAYITREDGYWLLPFGITAFLICAAFVLPDKTLDRRVLRLSLRIIPVFMTFAAYYTVCNINEKYYGAFTVSDFASGSFAECYGNMTRLSHEKWNPLVAVPQDVRERMYEGSETFASFEEPLENGLPKKAFFKKRIGDYQSGSFYWALRLAAQEQGYYTDYDTADALWKKLSGEVEVLAEADPDRLGPRSTVTPPVRKEYVKPVIDTSIESIIYVFSLKDMERFEDSISDVTTGRLAKIEEFLYTKSNYAAVENESFPYYTSLQKTCFSVCGAITSVFRILVIPLFAASLIGAIRQLFMFGKIGWRKKLLALIIPGFVLMGLFRIRIISFMEVAAFNIGIYSMYLGCVYPLVMITGALAGAVWSQDTVAVKENAE